MFKRPKTDMWVCGLIPAPIADMVQQGSPAAAIHWLPSPARAFTFDADPFAVWVDDSLHILVETYDYRTKIGAIDAIILNKNFEYVSRHRVLSRPYHLSFPCPIVHDGMVFIVPESHRAGVTSLYAYDPVAHHCAHHCDILPFGAVDPVVAQWGGQWHVFYSLKSSQNGMENSALYHAISPSLFGPYTPQTAPVYAAPNAARCAGTAFTMDNRLHLPVQHAEGTYGSHVSYVVWDDDRQIFTPTHHPRVAASVFAHPTHKDGVHTWAQSVGDGPIVTVFDVKQINRSYARIAVNWQRRLQRILDRF